ncbi:MAG: hypothetical protein V5B30_19565 [Candidatus Accumulibacter delftensis]
MPIAPAGEAELEVAGGQRRPRSAHVNVYAGRDFDLAEHFGLAHQRDLCLQPQRQLRLRRQAAGFEMDRREHDRLAVDGIVHGEGSIAEQQLFDFPAGLAVGRRGGGGDGGVRAGHAAPAASAGPAAHLVHLGGATVLVRQRHRRPRFAQLQRLDDDFLPQQGEQGDFHARRRKAEELGFAVAGRQTARRQVDGQPGEERQRQIAVQVQRTTTVRPHRCFDFRLVAIDIEERDGEGHGQRQERRRRGSADQQAPPPGS